MSILSEIPTASAMKELSKTTAPLKATRKAIETMAIEKDALIRCLRHMRFRELLLRKRIEQMEKSAVIDGTLSKLIQENGNDYEIVFDDKAN